MTDALENQIPFKSPDCERAMECQTLLLAGEQLATLEKQWLDRHLAQCAECHDMMESLCLSDRELKEACESVQLSPDFALKTMAALPLISTDVIPQPTVAAEGMRVFAVPANSSRWIWRASLAAAVFVTALGTVLLMLLGHSRVSAEIARGSLVDAQGQPVAKLEIGHTYTAKEDTVLRVGPQSQLKAREGTNFQIDRTGAGQTPQLRLESGDLYAAQSEAAGSSDQNPMVVVCSNFLTELHAGDFYVAEDVAERDEPRSVVIVFRGHASVTPMAEESVRLGEGEIYVSMGSNSHLRRKRMAVAEAVAASIELQDINGLKKEYQIRVIGYQRELKQLNELLASAKEKTQIAELKARWERVVSYLNAHQRKLESLTQAASGITGPDKMDLPFDQIERGLNGHSDPSSWL